LPLLFVGHWQGQNANNHLAFAGGFKRSSGFRTDIVVDAPYIQNENNHPAFAGGHSHC
jgi:hypothetical protein